MLPRRRPTDHGLTLIEVLVALAVIAIGLLAVVAVAARSGEVDSALRERTFGDWVAANEITRLRLATNWPAIGESDGQATLAGRNWHWQASVATTPDRDLRRVTVTVAPADATGHIVARLLGFVGKPAPQLRAPQVPSSASAGGGATGMRP